MLLVHGNPSNYACLSNPALHKHNLYYLRYSSLQVILKFAEIPQLER